jgi:hypothetical protein
MQLLSTILTLTALPFLTTALCPDPHPTKTAVDKSCNYEAIGGCYSGDGSYVGCNTTNAIKWTSVEGGARVANSMMNAWRMCIV